jgi:hypothetical protein
MDKPELNTLLQGQRWTSNDIEQAELMCVDYWNSANPPAMITYSLESFPHRYLLIIGTAATLLRSAAINEASNQFSYAADGVQINDKDKAQIFANIGNGYWEEFKKLTQDIKLNLNIAQSFGTAYSEYIYRVR